MEKGNMFAFSSSLLLVLFASGPALAYVGPGAGITMLGALWGIVVAILLAVGAMVYWPVRVMLRRRRKQRLAEGPQQAVEAVVAGTGSGERHEEGRV